MIYTNIYIYYLKFNIVKKYNIFIVESQLPRFLVSPKCTIWFYIIYYTTTQLFKNIVGSPFSWRRYKKMYRIQLPEVVYFTVRTHPEKF